LSEEGVQRRKKIFATLPPSTFVLREKSVAIPETRAEVHEIDFREYKVSKPDWALASLGVLADKEKVLTKEMLEFALRSRFSEKLYLKAMETIKKVVQG
ncbi:MAG: 2-oxoglutarate synthase, partial [Desulforhopalus sp.]